MEFLMYPRTDYLLESSLESLHTECVAWEKEVAFWSDEVDFLFKVLHMRELKKLFPSERVAALDVQLVKVKAECDNLKSRLADHARALAFVFRETSPNDQSFRDEQKKLLYDMHALNVDISKAKREVHSFFIDTASKN